MGIRSSATLDTYKNLITGSGVLYFNFKSFNGANYTKVGATRGGFQINTNISLRDVESDNLQGATKGLVFKDKGNPELTVTLLEMTKENLQNLIAGARVNGNVITAENIKLDDYLENVTWVGRLNDNKRIMMIQLYNVLPNDPSITFSDNDEGTLSVTFKAHYQEGESFTDKDGFPLYPMTITIGEPFLDEADTTTITGITGTSKYIGIAKADNGKLYCAPLNAENVLIIDPVANTADTTSITGLTGTNKYIGIAKADNGKLYCAPFNAENVLTIE